MSDSKLIFPAWMIFNFGETCFKFIFQKKIFLKTFPQVPDSKLIL